MVTQDGNAREIVLVDLEIGVATGFVDGGDQDKAFLHSKVMDALRQVLRVLVLVQEQAHQFPSLVFGTGVRQSIMEGDRLDRMLDTLCRIALKIKRISNFHFGAIMVGIVSDVAVSDVTRYSSSVTDAEVLELFGERDGRNLDKHRRCSVVMSVRCVRLAIIVIIMHLVGDGGRDLAWRDVAAWRTRDAKGATISDVGVDGVDGLARGSIIAVIGVGTFFLILLLEGWGQEGSEHGGVARWNRGRSSVVRVVDTS